MDLLTYPDDVGQSVLLGETTLGGVWEGGSYRLDILLDVQTGCGLLDFIDDNSTQVILNGNNETIDWTYQGKSVSFIGLPSDIEQALDNLRIVREPSGFGPPLECDASILRAFLVVSNTWTGNDIPQGQAGYILKTDSPIPVMFDRQDDQSTTSPRLLRRSDGFEVEWNEYLGATGFTPSGFTLRYRDVTNSGAWIYQTIPYGNYLSAGVSGLSDAGITYEAQIAPIVQDCNGTTFYGPFSYMANEFSQFGIDPNAAPVGQSRTTGREVAPQCYSACTPVESVEFDGTNLATIFKFTNTDPCTWAVPSNLTSATVDVYVVGGGGGGGAAGGGGGGGGDVQTSLGLAIDPGTPWTLLAGLGGSGAQDVNAIQGDSGANSVVIHPNANESGEIIARGGGGGGSKDQLGINSASVISGGNGINTGATQAMSYGGSSSAGLGDVGITHTVYEGEHFGTGGDGGPGSSTGSSSIPGVFGSGGGGGAVCVQTEPLNYSGGESQNNGTGGDCRGNNQDGLVGANALDNSGGGGGGGASDLDFGDGAGGDGADGVVYIVHTEEPLARYIPSGCVDFSGECSSWVPTNGNGDLAASTIGAPIISSTSSPALNGSTLQSSFPVVQGGPYDAIDFPVLLASNYTFFSVARYNKTDNGKYRRIFDGKSGNWLSGFHNGVSGVAYHGDEAGWIGGVEETDPKHGFNWVLSTDARSMYRSNGIPIDHSTGPPGAVPVYVSINSGSFGINNLLNMEPQTSDFQVADVLFFDRELSQNEYIAVEAYLSNQYGICTSNCPPLVFSTSSQLPDGESDTPYLQTITAMSTYGNPISYAVLDTTPLPAELSFNTMTGELSGTPATALTLTFTVEATDTVTGETAQREFTVTFSEFVPPPPEPPVFTSTSPLPAGDVNQEYTQTIVATSPDENSISYSVVDGDSLPAGLSLDATTGELYGTPTTAGTYTFSVLATDTVNAETTQQEFTITINEEQSPPPDLTPYEEDVDFGRFKWFGVGAGIGNVAVQVPADEAPAQVLGSGSMRAYWIPNLNADPLTVGIEILCADTPDSSFGYQAAHAEVFCPEFDLSQAYPGLTAQIKRNFAASDPWHQISVVLTNSSDSEEITGLIAYRIDLASGSNTAIAMTSDGDLELENTDKWFLTRDSGANSRPVSLHYFGDLEDGRVSQDDSESGAGKFWIKKPVTVPAASNQTHRFIDGFTDLTANAAGSDSGQAVIVAMKAADQLEHQRWNDSSSILSTDLSDIVSEDRDLPALRIQYDCRDFGRSAIYPVVVQNNGQPIGCNIGLSDGGYGEGMGGPGEDAELDAGLYPSLEDGDKKADWIQQFRYTFPNATPRLGWACDSCIMTSAGPVQVDLSETPSEVADGLPLGFTTNAGGQDNLDSVRILPQGIVQLHSSEENDPLNGVAISAFGNTALGNGSIQGTWDELPEYDYFYWGRTEYQGRLAFVVTWVKMPSLDTDSNPISGGSTTMQLMLVSDSDPSGLGDYFSLPEERQNSNVDIIWNYDSIQPQGAVNFLTDFPADNSVPIPFYAGIFSTTDGLTPLVSDAFTTGGVSTKVGLGEGDCVALCVSEHLLENRLQSPVNGRYVIGLRTYEILTPDPSNSGTIPGLVAPAAPRSVEVSRTMGDSAIVSWQKPVPWVISWLFDSADGINPILGYRIEYAINTRGESTDCDGPGASGCYTTLPELDDDPLSETSEAVTVMGSGDTERLSITIPELDVKENYTFRVFAVYAGLDFPESTELEQFPPDVLFNQEVRSAPATANEQHDSELQIVTVATDPEAIVGGAQGIAGFIAGNLDVTNATVNGSPFAYGQTAKSIATFSGGEDSIGIDSGIVIAPLVDARTFQRGSGITATDSSGKTPSYFADPNHRTKYFESVNDFTDFLSTQESWVPGDGFKPIFDCGPAADCAEGTTVLQFDIAKPEENEFLKFEYALAGLETTNSNGISENAEVYEYPDGFGLFIGDINQESSCALVPQVGEETEAQRFMSMGNALNARLANEVEFNSDLNAETVSSVMSCNFDVSEIDSETITITMAIANANDNILSTAVFIKSESIRFEPTSITLEEIPGAQIYQTYETKQFSATGTPPTSWSAENLPNGMSLTSDGILEGTPTETGSFNFVVTALDGETVLATQSFTIQVADVERGSEVRNVRITLYDDERIFWEHPIGSPEDMLYDVYYRAGSDQEYVLARGKECTEVSNDRCLDFGGNTISVQDFTYPIVELRDSYDANTNYQFKIVARWPDDATVSETVVTATSWRDVCLGENSCSYTQSGQITNDAFWEEISFEIDEARTIQGNEDAFEGALNVYIGDGNVSEAHRVSCDFSTLDVIRDEDLENDPIIGHEIVCSDDFYEDLEIKLSRYFFSDEQWTRTMVEVTNNDLSDEFNGTVWLVSNLGSDSDTFYEATSSSNGLQPTSIVANDTWAVTSDGRDDEDPILIHMLGDLKDENYSTLGCWESDDVLFEGPARNSNGCGNVITGHEITVPSEGSAKKAWFTGLVGYSDPLLFDNAKNQAILAAGDFAADETSWTGDMSDFVVPSLFYEIPELTCKSREVLEEEPALSVVLLNKQLENPDGQSNQSSFSSSTALATQLCNSPYLITTIFDGGDGSESAWENALADTDVLVLPETESDLLGSDLLQTSGMAYLTEWVRDGGRVVLTGSSRYLTELENILGIEGTLQTQEWQSSTQVSRFTASNVLGASLPVETEESEDTNVGNLSERLLRLDDSAFVAISEANVSLLNLYGDLSGSDWLSAVTKFQVGRGQASYLSSNFEGEPNGNWNEILLHSVYGTETSEIEITESGKNWNLWRSGVYWTEMNPAASFKLGGLGDSTSLACMNTPANPAIRKVSPEGTEIICGKQLVQDGLVDAGVSAQLSRFVTKSGDWMSSNIVITNNDREDTYENQVWFGGSQNSSSSMSVEATSLSPNGTTNLSGEQPDFAESSEWIVASEGAGINNVHGESTSEVVTHIFEPRPNAHHGGSGRPSWLRMPANEIQSDWWIYLESDQSISISALTGRMSYEPGCDRTAVEISKNAARTITESEGLFEIPSLRTDCESLSATTSSVSAQNSGTNVSVSWSPVATATHYELSHRVGSSGDWSSPTSIPATADTTMSTLISNLSRSTDYEFRVRAKRMNFGAYGDNAFGLWSENVAAVRTSAAPVIQPPPTTPPTTPPVTTPPVTTPPVTTPPVTTPVVSQVVPQKISQKAPKFPTRLNKGKTAKFTMKAPSGLPLKVTSVGKCKTTKVMKTVNVKVLVGKKKVTKKVKLQTGWVVTATSKGVCTVKFANSGDATRNPLSVTGKITVK